MSGSPRWLLYLLELARTKGWCSKVGCTTCAAGEFRSTLCILLCRNAGIQPPDGYGDGRAVVLTQLFPASYRTVVKRAVDDMALADEAEVMACAGGRWFSDLHMILSELRLSPRPSAYDLPLVVRLKRFGIWAKVFSMVEAGLANAQRRRNEYALRVERDIAKSEEKRSQRAAAVLARKKLSTERSALIADAILKFRMLPTEEKLLALADDRFGLPLGAVPVCDIPDDPGDTTALSEEAKTSLIGKIDRRKGRWAKLKVTLTKSDAVMPQ